MTKTEIKRAQQSLEKMAKKPRGYKRTEKSISGKHTGASEDVHGIRGRTCKHKDAEKVSEDTEE